ncbi:unnamed protein product [Didymodactylos carnosus]|uniref:Uncharacterized protein n=1 Tax=Didymodactylos carnosus TaxID=1234261 RepID=A0A814EUD1_9BILA|nr:unnamed protein product [Didymodactylos carnosus]CAF0973905.1 unnamed protein product [Didymodactylos carnosus]CAF3511071.1 unnamed protein product [Didymodactylos carnosus]CAF3746813.1 unnamed protein product [Didymodactylos carnosus]
MHSTTKGNHQQLGIILSQLQNDEQRYQLLQTLRTRLAGYNLSVESIKLILDLFADEQYRFQVGQLLTTALNKLKADDCLSLLKGFQDEKQKFILFEQSYKKLNSDTCYDQLINILNEFTPSTRQKAENLLRNNYSELYTRLIHDSDGDTSFFQHEHHTKLKYHDPMIKQQEEKKKTIADSRSLTIITTIKENVTKMAGVEQACTKESDITNETLAHILDSITGTKQKQSSTELRSQLPYCEEQCHHRPHSILSSTAISVSSDLQSRESENSAYILKPMNSANKFTTEPTGLSNSDTDETRQQQHLHKQINAPFGLFFILRYFMSHLSKVCNEAVLLASTESIETTDMIINGQVSEIFYKKFESERTDDKTFDKSPVALRLNETMMMTCSADTTETRDDLATYESIWIKHGNEGNQKWLYNDSDEQLSSFVNYQPLTQIQFQSKNTSAQIYVYEEDDSGEEQSDGDQRLSLKRKLSSTSLSPQPIHPPNTNDLSISSSSSSMSSHNSVLYSETNDPVFESFVINDNKTVLNIIDTPGLFERGSDEIDVKDNATILKTIELCIVREITKFHLVCFYISKHSCLIVTRSELKNDNQREKLRNEVNNDQHFKELVKYFKQGIYFSGALNRDDYNNASKQNLLVQFQTICKYSDELIALFGNENTEPYPMRECAFDDVKQVFAE